VRVNGLDGQPLTVARLTTAFDDARALLVHASPGSFTVEAETDTGLSARGGFSVGSLADQDAPLVF